MKSQEHSSVENPIPFHLSLGPAIAAPCSSLHVSPGTYEAELDFFCWEPNALWRGDIKFVEQRGSFHSDPQSTSRFDL